MIVTAKPPRKRRQEPRKVAIACGVLVTPKKPGPRHPALGPKAASDPEAEERAAAWLAKQLRSAVT